MNGEMPSFFKRGPAPLARLCLYILLSLALMILDARFQTLALLRAGVFRVVHPMRQLALTPVLLYERASVYFSSLSHIQEENARLKHAQLESDVQRLRVQQVEIENDRLRRLLDMKTLKKVGGQVARILYVARDPFSRRLIADKGALDGISPGQAVADYDGIVGRVVRVFPQVSEIALITDRNHALPVQVLRNGLRSVLFGLGNGQLEARFTPINADVREGDQLVTSGLDGLFPAGLPAARVVRVDHDASDMFARIYCVPQAGIEHFGELMILESHASLALPPEISADPADGRKHPRKRLARE